jgi:hypothetical protein
MEAASAQALTVTQFARRRWRFCVALAICAGLLHAAPEFLEGESLDGIMVPALLWVLELPIQVFALSLTYDCLVATGRSSTFAHLACVGVAASVGTALALGFVFVFQAALGYNGTHGPPGPPPYPLVAALGAVSGVAFAGVWGLGIVSPHSAEQDRRRQLEEQRLRFEADQLRASSELARLRSQLEPHFLMNTLNTIAGLVAQRPSEARRLLGCLGDLLRDALENEHEMQTLEREIAWLRRYAHILESRHGDALRFDWDIPAEASRVLLPRLLLQPLIENAVQHGALSRAGGGRVAVGASLVESAGSLRTLVCTVWDNGPGPPTGEPRLGAIGLHTVRRRLELQCPGSALRLETSSDGTLAVVEVLLPQAAA